MTSKELADIVIEENRPFDYRWIRYVRNREGFPGLLRIAIHSTSCFADKNCSKQLIGRAARIVAETMDDETW